jgi:ATP-dependent Clp protease ATP-binding subunit ClpC
MLLGIIASGQCIGVDAMTAAGLDPVKVVSAVEFILGTGETQIDRPALSPRLKKVLEISLKGAGEREAHLVDTGDLLCGLLEEGQCVAAGVLDSYGLTLEQGKCAALIIRAMLPPI